MHKNESKEDLSRSSRRGKFHTAKYSPNEVRTHCVSVRLNEEELSILDSKRGPYKKGMAKNGIPQQTPTGIT